MVTYSKPFTIGNSPMRHWLVYWDGLMLGAICQMEDRYWITTYPPDQPKGKMDGVKYRSRALVTEALAAMFGKKYEAPAACVKEVPHAG